MIGELKAAILLLPAILAGAAAAPGADVALHSILMRWALIGCVLGGYLGTVVELLRRRSSGTGTPIGLAFVMDLLARWSGAAIVGWVGAVVLFEWQGWVPTIGRVLACSFVMGVMGFGLAMKLVPKLRAWAEKRAVAALEGLGSKGGEP